MNATIIPFPVHRVTNRGKARRYSSEDREHALDRIAEARRFLATDPTDFFQRGHAEWLLQTWTEKLAQIDQASNSVIPLGRVS